MNPEFAPDDNVDPDEKTPPAPISFKIMVGLAVLYVGWRLIQAIIWLVGRLV